MPSPIAPSEFRSVVPSMSGSTCDKFHKAFKTFPELLSDWFAYVYNEDGNFTDEFKADLCAIDCSTVTGSGGSGTTTLSTPAPSFGAPAAGEVVLSWPAVASAAYYEVWRNTSYDLFSAAIVGATTDVVYHDTAVSGTTYYYYWIRARNLTSTSGFSAVVSAFTSGTGSLALPGDPIVTATDGTISEYVLVNWTAVQGALDYNVYRNTVDTTTGADLLITTKQVAYADFHGSPGVTYFYIVRARNGLTTATAAGVIGSR